MCELLDGRISGRGGLERVIVGFPRWASGSNLHGASQLSHSSLIGSSAGLVLARSSRSFQACTGLGPLSGSFRGHCSLCFGITVYQQ